MALLESRTGDKALIDMVAADTLVRHDIHTLDLLAWALYRSGRLNEALPIMRRALATGTAEPTLRYHAAMIEFGAGDPTLGGEHRLRALSRRKALTSVQVGELLSAGRN
jgi:hypothetical protein